MVLKEETIQRDEHFYKIARYYAPHTGILRIEDIKNAEVKKDQVLYTLTRLGIPRIMRAKYDGKITAINPDFNNKFIEYNTHILDLEHKLSDDEKRVLEEEEKNYIVTAQFGAEYYLTPNPGAPPLAEVGKQIRKGEVIAIAMVMKKRREIEYDGPEGKIEKIYFVNGEQRKPGEKLFGIRK